MVTRARRLKRAFFGIFLKDERVVMWPCTLRMMGMNKTRLMASSKETGASNAYLKMTPLIMQLKRIKQKING